MCTHFLTTVCSSVSLLQSCIDTLYDMFIVHVGVCLAFQYFMHYPVVQTNYYTVQYMYVQN